MAQGDTKKFDFRSIRFRVWLYFLGFTVIILVLIYFLQIFFINNYYEEMKINRTEESAQEMMSLLNSGNQDGFVAKANTVTEDNDVFVRLEKGEELLYPSVETLAYSSEIQDARSGLIAAAKNGHTTYTFTVLNDLKQKRTYIFAAYLGDSQEDILFVISPLYPVRSTVAILKNQFIFIIIIALMLAVLISYYLTTRITHPIRSINRAARRLAEGEYGTVFNVDQRGFSEIAELSSTLSKTSRELGKSAALQKDLMANVSHDLRTPLTMIKSYAEMIRDISGDKPEKREAHLQVIIDETDRLNTLVNDMMVLSQMQAGTMDIQMGTFGILEAIASIVAPYRLLEEEEGYDIRIQCREDYLVRGDEEKIKQVISNLVTNAIKYCGTDKQILINARRWGSRVHIEVIDHGVGIKPEELSHIWERYYKTSTNHVRTTTGSGLGLSIVKEILTLHNARFGAESKVGKGTTMWFELQIVEEQSTAAARPHLPHWPIGRH